MNVVLVLLLIILISLIILGIFGYIWLVLVVRTINEITQEELEMEMEDDMFSCLYNKDMYYERKEDKTEE